MTCGIPTKLIEEILTGMAEQQRLGGKVVLDLCSGFQSIRDAVLKAGATYVAVDVKGDRRNQRSLVIRRAAMLLQHGKRVLAIKHKLRDGTSCWTLPGGKREQSDPSLFHTAVRELEEETGLGWDRLKGDVASGPRVWAMPDTTYFACALNAGLSQDELRRNFQRCRDQHKAEDLEWIDFARARGLVWRSEDDTLLRKIYA